MVVFQMLYMCMVAIGCISDAMKPPLGRGGQGLAVQSIGNMSALCRLCKDGSTISYAVAKKALHPYKNNKGIYGFIYLPKCQAQ